MFNGINFKDEFDKSRNSSFNFIQFISKLRSLSKHQAKQVFYLKLEPTNFSLEININLLEEENQILITFKDISSFKKLQKTKNREKTTNLFINSTAHNIFTPINSIQVIMDLLERELANNQIGQKYVEIMRTCLAHLTFNTQNIIQLSKIRLKKFIVNNQPCLIGKSVFNFLDVFKHECSQK